MAFQNVTLSLPSGLVGTLRMMALERDAALDDLVRGMLDREAMRLRSARAAVEAHEHRVSRLRHLLAPDMQRATDWADLQSRLALYGVELRGAGGGLMLHDHITGEGLCSCVALGFGYSELMRRFGGPMPEELSAVPAA